MGDFSVGVTRAAGLAESLTVGPMLPTPPRPWEALGEVVERRSWSAIYVLWAVCGRFEKGKGVDVLFRLFLLWISIPNLGALGDYVARMSNGFPFLSRQWYFSITCLSPTHASPRSHSPRKGKDSKEELFDEIDFERNRIKREAIIRDL